MCIWEMFNINKNTFMQNILDTSTVGPVNIQRTIMDLSKWEGKSLLDYLGFDLSWDNS